MNALLLSLGLLACVEKPPPAAHHEAPSSSARFESIYPALAQRDGEVKCAPLLQGVADPVALLSDFVDQVQSPPYAGMRAASCLLSEFPVEAESIFVRWLGDPHRLGLALLVKTRLPSLPAPQRWRLLEAAVIGPHRDHFLTP